MKKVLILILSVVVMAGSLWADNRKQIKRDQLPKAAQHYVMNNWNNVAISYCWQEIDGYKIEYTVRLVDGTTIEFNRDGGWKEVESSVAIPESAIPAAIRTYVKQNHRGAAILKMEKDTRGYEIELDNEKELQFDKKGNFLR